MMNRFKGVVLATASVAILASAGMATAETQQQRAFDATASFSHGVAEAWDDRHNGNFAEAKSWVSDEVLEANSEFRVAGYAWASIELDEKRLSISDMEHFVSLTEPQRLKQLIDETPAFHQTGADISASALGWALDGGLPNHDAMSDDYMKAVDTIKTMHAYAIDIDYPAHTDFQAKMKSYVIDAVEGLVVERGILANPLDELSAIDINAMTHDPFAAPGLKNDGPGGPTIN